jgi:hypothetical protein
MAAARCCRIFPLLEREEAMFQRTMQSVVVCTLVVTLIGTTTLAHAQESYPMVDQTTTTPSAEAMLADVVFLRPAGFVATVFGAVIFVISLPVSLPTRSAGVAAEKLVVHPAKYTFARPLGVPEPGTGPDIGR